jgi:preprotein translocase subunit Sss1
MSIVVGAVLFVVGAIGMAVWLFVKRKQAEAKGMDLS